MDVFSAGVYYFLPKTDVFIVFFSSLHDTQEKEYTEKGTKMKRISNTEFEKTQDHQDESC